MRLEIRGRPARRRGRFHIAWNDCHAGYSVSFLGENSETCANGNNAADFNKRLNRSLRIGPFAGMTDAKKSYAEAKALGHSYQIIVRE
jgi:hypothetical protein